MLSPLRDVVNAAGTFCEIICILMIISDKVLTELGTLYKTRFSFLITERQSVNTLTTGAAYIRVFFFISTLSTTF